MKKIAAFWLILPMVMGSISQGFSVSNTQNVDIEFMDGFGIRIIIWNHNDYPIYNISLESLDIAGLIFFGLSPGVTFLQEIKTGEHGYLVTPIFGFGWLIVTAKLSYYDQGEKIEREIHADLFIIGTIVGVIEQW
ncbi:MAG: hypothetical protein FE048_01375 [Thermoplasmata archaeon]|nr:MAG: hypothetical protein FE048_01375 [Thermoplasmata archaeon]